MPRVIFVGIHNKPAKQPLCSSTKTGKVIHEIMRNVLPINNAILLTNLFEVEYMPNFISQQFLFEEWMQKYRPTNEDIIVLLGKKVQEWFEPYEYDFNLLNVYHPSYVIRKGKQLEYVEDVTKKITQLITETAVS